MYHIGYFLSDDPSIGRYVRASPGWMIRWFGFVGRDGRARADDETGADGWRRRGTKRAMRRRRMTRAR